MVYSLSALTGACRLQGVHDGWGVRVPSLRTSRRRTAAGGARHGAGQAQRVCGAQSGPLPGLGTLLLHRAGRLGQQAREHTAQVHGPQL